MVRRLSISLLCAAFLLSGALPSLEEHFGYTPGDAYKLAGFDEIIGYFRKLEKASGRIRLVEFGRSSHGKPMYVAFLSSEENLRNLDRYREISRRLALGQAEADEARRLAGEGKAIVWIDSGLHATEVAPVQHSPHLAWRIVSDESDEIRRIRENVILLQVPCINPDGLDWVVEWYRGNLGTPYELARLPRLFQKYAGHDNNRDWFMMNLEETRHVSRLLFREWFPQIVYNQHQTPAFPARIFVPPYADPLNPNIPAAVMEGIHMIGSAIKERMAREDKPGVLSYHQFDAWWNGGLRTAPAFHNMHGVLTETALYLYATPREYKKPEIPERFAGGISAREPTIFYQRPWMGGKWTLRDAIDYMLTADFAILDLAASRSSEFLTKAYDLARTSIERGRRGSPHAYVISPEQWDPSAVPEFLRRLWMAGVEVRRAKAEFTANGKKFPVGTWVLPAAQAFRPYLTDLLEPQKYPDLRTAQGTSKRPYDVAGWTLSMQMGIAVDRVDAPFEAVLELEDIPDTSRTSLDHRENASFIATADLLSRGKRVRWGPKGEILVDGVAERADFERAAWELHRPRVALYVPWAGNTDTGWTQWLLDYYRVPYTPVRNGDIARKDLKQSYDAVILARQTAASILNGERFGEASSGRELTDHASPEIKTAQRPEYTGGIGPSGLAALDEFVRQGGTLIALDDAAELPVQFFPLALRNVTRGSDEGARFESPGSLLRITVDPSHPIAFGMPEEAIAFSTGGHAYEISLLPEFNKGDREIRSVARYARGNLLASGWLSGEKTVLGKHVLLEARHGQGRVIVFGFRPQFRGQPFGTFKLLLNAIYLASARPLSPEARPSR